VATPITKSSWFPEVSSLMNRYKILREGHPLLTAGKRLDSLYEFYDAAKEVSERWKPQNDFIVVGDAMLKARASLLIVSNCLTGNSSYLA